MADGWGAGDWKAGEHQGCFLAQITVASLFKDINNWVKNGDIATAVSLLSLGAVIGSGLTEEQIGLMQPRQNCGWLQLPT